jgi:cytochrome c-type biogenesis protein CcmH
MMGRITALLLMLALAFVSPAGAVEPDEVLDDPALEARARSLSAGLRCLVCQNQSIDDSDADLARDLRLLVRERLVAGDSDEEVMDFVVERYGTFVLLRPPLDASTLVLWLTPFALALIGAGFVAVRLLKRKSQGGQQANRGLSADEEAKLAKILDQSE